MARSNMLLAFGLLGALAFGGVAAAQTAAPAASGKAPAAAAKPAASALIDINSASKTDLMSLKGVGDKRASDIIKGRPYKGKDELVQKNIVPAGVYADIKDKIIAKQK